MLALGVPASLAGQMVTMPSGPVEVPGAGLVVLQPVPKDDTTSQRRVVDVPGIGKVLVVPVRPADNRSLRQMCIDEAVRREGGRPSRLTWRAIDLKCSQH